jgi:hypothetical protein
MDQSLAGISQSLTGRADVMALMSGRDRNCGRVPLRDPSTDRTARAFDRAPATITTPFSPHRLATGPDG